MDEDKKVRIGKDGEPVKTPEEVIGEIRHGCREHCRGYKNNCRG